MRLSDIKLLVGLEALADDSEAGNGEMGSVETHDANDVGNQKIAIFSLNVKYLEILSGKLERCIHRKVTWFQEGRVSLSVCCLEKQAKFPRCNSGRDGRDNEQNDLDAVAEIVYFRHFVFSFCDCRDKFE